MQKIAKVVILGIFLGFIGTFFVLNILMPDAEISQQENRYLQKLPAFSFQKLFKGNFTSEFETYTTDQFPFRDQWISLKAGSELAMGKKENNDVFFCGNNKLIPRYTAPDGEEIEQKVGFLNALVEKSSIPVYFGLIPGASEVQSDCLPENAPCDSQQDVIDLAYSLSKAQNIDFSSSLLPHKDEYIFYNTDHHWTSLGAYYGYCALSEGTGMKPLPLDSYQRQIVSDSFYGTTYSSSGFTWVAPDKMETFIPDDGTVTVYNYKNKEAVPGPLYDTSYLDVKDKYSMFLGGVSPLRSVETNHEGPRLLLVRDSYSDSLTPFLTTDFSRIDLIDLRYYRQSLLTYAEENDFDMILVLYSVSNFSTDKNLFLLNPSF